MIGAASAPAPDFLLAAVLAGGMLAIMFVFLVVYASRYAKVGPNEVLIVSGKSHRMVDASGRERTVGFRIVKGGGTFVWPVIEKAEVLSLEAIPARVSILGFEASACVRIKGDPASILAASERFLSKKPEEIATIAGDVLERHARRAISGGKPDREAVERQVAEGAGADLAPMGLELAPFTVKESRDGLGR